MPSRPKRKALPCRYQWSYKKLARRKLPQVIDSAHASTSVSISVPDVVHVRVSDQIPAAVSDTVSDQVIDTVDDNVSVSASVSISIPETVPVQVTDIIPAPVHVIAPVSDNNSDPNFGLNLASTLVSIHRCNHKAKKHFTAREKKIIVALTGKCLEKGITLKESLIALENHGIKIHRNSVQSWIKQYKKNKNFNRLVKETRGRPSLVSVGEIQVMLGFCLQKTKDSETLNPDVVAEFVEKSFGIKVQRKWASRFLKNQGFSLKQTSYRQAGYEYNTDMLVSIAKNWFSNNFDLYFKNPDTSKIMSLDFTYSSYRTARNTTWSPRGSKQPKKKEGHTRYTNCFVTVCWADGKKSVKMYTYNPQFKTIAYWERSITATGKPCNVTHRRKRIHNRYIDLLEEFNLNASNIILLENSKQTYVRESAELLKKWLDDSKDDIQDGTLILHDEGSAFSELADDENFNSKSLKHLVYPPEVHELLSPNDNGWHGPAKKQWRTKCSKRYVDKNDGIEGSLLLLQCLADTKTETIKKHFKSNLFLGSQKITKKGITELIEERNFKIFSSKRNVEAVRVYHNWRNGIRLPETRNITLCEGL